MSLELHPRVASSAETYGTMISLLKVCDAVSSTNKGHEAAEVRAALEALGLEQQGELLKPKKRLQGLVAKRGGDVVVAFRGSGGSSLVQTLANARSDSKIIKVRPKAMLGDDTKAWVHRGFYKDYLRFQDDVRRLVEASRPDNVYVTGFSLGSSIATFCALDLALQGYPVTAQLFATPRCGTPIFKERFEASVERVLRVVDGEDPVARVPAPLHFKSKRDRGFRHVGRVLTLKQNGEPVPVDEVNGRFLGTKDSVKEHTIGGYLHSTRAFHKKWGVERDSVFGAFRGKDPLMAAARREAETTEG